MSGRCVCVRVTLQSLSDDLYSDSVTNYSDSFYSESLYSDSPYCDLVTDYSDSVTDPTVTW